MKVGSVYAGQARPGEAKRHGALAGRVCWPLLTVVLGALGIMGPASHAFAQGFDATKPVFGDTVGNFQHGFGSTNRDATTGPSPSSAAARDMIARRQTDPNAKMLVTADELVYDYRRDEVAAVGNVQIYYDGAVLEAKRVVYDRKNNRLRAEGNVRLKDRDGKLITAENLDLAQDFSTGFVNSLRIDTPDNMHFAAARAERTGGNTTTLTSGAYTPCEPCKENPEKPPLWQVKAAKIIHNESEQTIYFEDARLEFMGVPIAWLPYFSAPDPTVKRKSGFLIPKFINTTEIGFGVSTPYFWNIAPEHGRDLLPAGHLQAGPAARRRIPPSAGDRRVQRPRRRHRPAGQGRLLRHHERHPRPDARLSRPARPAWRPTASSTSTSSGTGAGMAGCFPTRPSSATMT